MSNDATLKNLNKALQMELSAAHQYQLHAHTLQDWGLEKLAAQMREEMAEEIGHSDRFIERILFLKGEPVMAFDKKPKRAAKLVDMSKAASQAGEVGDIGSRRLFEGIVLEEEGHKAWLELQLDLIKRLGEAVYSARFIGGDAV